MRVKTGLDILCRDEFVSLRGRRLAILAHPASVNAHLSHVSDLALRAGLDVRMLLGPEHGFGGIEQDMVPVADRPELTGKIPIVSLYGSSVDDLRPAAAAMSEVDVLLIDLQDVGARYYTFASTMRYCLELCAGTSTAVVVADRPNPIGGQSVEGPLLADDLHSFVGAFPVPVRHGLTMGELALSVRQQGVDVDLTVIPMEGWRRDCCHDQTGLPWVMPSPNMPSLSTAIVYPGACLIEACNLSEGRGTCRPFELLGAPWLNGGELARELNRKPIKGAICRAVSFRPMFQKHQGHICQGIQVHVTDRELFSPFFFGLMFLQAARRQVPDLFQWRSEPYEYVSDRPAIDLLCGTALIREALDRDQDVDTLPQSWQSDLRAFSDLRRSYLLYPETDR